jgi:riboflavin biosynthesis protein RibD
MITSIERPEDLALMLRCLELAERGRGRVWPNPLVGCVLVRDGVILAEGWHLGPGLFHAELDALQKVGLRAPNATLVVNLEPCCHYGRTPPCTNTIISSGVTRVVVGMYDPNPLVNGGGIKQLSHHGIEVVCGVAESLCLNQNKDFVEFINHQHSKE